MNPNGGAIAMMTTTRVVYSFANEQLNTAFFDVVFDAPVGTQQRLGDILRRTKNNPAAGASSNKRNFTLLGDVALKLATPDGSPHERGQWGARRRLGRYVERAGARSGQGYVADEAGNPDDGLQWLCLPHSVRSALRGDHPQQRRRRGRGQLRGWRNRIHTGAVRAEQGTFSFEFIVPRDIGYEPAPGRISYYAVDGDLDAHGYTEQVFVGGVSEDAVLDNEGPEIELFLNDTNFVDGGTTDPHPILLCQAPGRPGFEHRRQRDWTRSQGHPGWGHLRCAQRILRE